MKNEFLKWYWNEKAAERSAEQTERKPPKAEKGAERADFSTDEPKNEPDIVAC